MGAGGGGSGSVRPVAIRTAPAVVKQILRSVNQAGMEAKRETVGGYEATVCRMSRFRLRWLLTPLHTFVFLLPFGPSEATVEELNRFVSDATQYAARNQRKMPLGIQSTTAAVVVAIAESGEARDWATAKGRRYSVLSYPVFVDVAGGEVIVPKRIIIGGKYASYFEGLVRDHIVPALAASR